jgi:ABC-type antimicrobial peptide transport system permease subunit
MERQFIKLMFGYSVAVGILGSLLGLGGGIIMTPFLLNLDFIFGFEGGVWNLFFWNFWGFAGFIGFFAFLYFRWDIAWKSRVQQSEILPS